MSFQHGVPGVFDGAGPGAPFTRALRAAGHPAG